MSCRRWPLFVWLVSLNTDVPFLNRKICKKNILFILWDSDARNYDLQLHVALSRRLNPFGIWLCEFALIFKFKTYAVGPNVEYVSALRRRGLNQNPCGGIWLIILSHHVELEFVPRLQGRNQTMDSGPRDRIFGTFKLGRSHGRPLHGTRFCAVAYIAQTQVLSRGQERGITCKPISTNLKPYSKA